MGNTTLRVHPATVEGLTQRSGIRQSESAGKSDIQRFKAKEANLPRGSFDGPIPALPAADTPEALRSIAGELDRVLDELRTLEYRRQAAVAEMERRLHARQMLILAGVTVLVIVIIIVLKVATG